MKFAFIVTFSAMIGGLIGWILNISQLVKMISDPISGMFLLKIAGIFLAPLGAVLGWLGLM